MGKFLTDQHYNMYNSLLNINVGDELVKIKAR